MVPPEDEPEVYGGLQLALSSPFAQDNHSIPYVASALLQMQPDI